VAPREQYRPGVREQRLPAGGHRLLIAVDVVLGLAVAVVLVNAVRSPAQNSSAPAGLGYALAGLAGFAVAARRRWPLRMLLLAAAVSLSMLGLGFSRDPLIAVALVLYTVAVVEPVRVSLSALAAISVAISAVLVGVAPSYGDERFTGITPVRLLATLSVQAAAWAIGVAVRRQRAYTEAVRERARREIEAQRDLAWRAVTEERLRIARDLHDVVAHSMSVIAVQAGVGHHLMTEHPDQARAALAVIETTTRDVLREMRLLLGVLRDDPLDRDPATFAPTPVLADLGDLVARAAGAGVRVDLHVTGRRRRLPDGVEAAAYRIVQEALTNVVKHAEADRSRVWVDYRPDALAVEVTDDGPGPERQPAEGHGIIGMRERATMYGGDFEAGPLPIRGFRVAICLPILQESS
jgi:signal transduction histidine kinase